jgi:hypothetical protein
VANLILDGSYSALWLLAAAETAVLAQVLRRVLRLHAEMYDAMPLVVRQKRLLKGIHVDFEARDLATGAVVRSVDLRGAPATLLFLGPRDVGGESSDWLLASVAGLKDKGDGRLMVLWQGVASSCPDLPPAVGEDVQVLLDEKGDVRRRFLIESTPTAVLLDSEASVALYGKPEYDTDSAMEEE